MAPPRTACALHATVGRFRFCLQKWGIRGMAPVAACECGAEEQTIGHVALHSPIHQPLYGAGTIAGKPSTVVFAFVQEGLTLKHLTKLHLFIVFHISIWGLGTLIGRAKPTKVPRGDWTVWRALPDPTGWRDNRIWLLNTCSDIWCGQAVEFKNWLKRWRGSDDCNGAQRPNALTFV